MNPSLSKLYKYLCLAVLGLIALGGGVRVMNAGLACPDWPLCFGELIPDYHPEVYFEFIHRVWAGVVSIVTVAASVVIFKDKMLPKEAKWVAAFSLVLLFVQVIMGGLTVLKLLKVSIVTAHLLLGTGFLGSLFWLYCLFAYKRNGSIPIGWGHRLVGILPLVFTYFQIMLGGLVATSYAGLACHDFPLCNGYWVPTLEGPVGLQVIHRFGAYLLTLVILLNYLHFRFYKKASWARPEVLKTAELQILMVFVQIIIGIMNVKFFTPPLITVLHLTVAAILLCLSLRLTFFMRDRAA